MHKHFYQIGNPSWVDRRVRKKFGDQGYFDGIVVGIELSDDVSGAVLYQIEYEDNDGEDLYSMELEAILLPRLTAAEEAIAVAKIRAKRVAALNRNVRNVDTPKPSSNKKRRKRVQKHFAVPQGKNVFFLLDCETTGSRRNYDRVIESPAGELVSVRAPGGGACGVLESHR